MILAQKALQKKPCAQLYGNAQSWAKGYTPQNVLKGIVNGDKYGKVVTGYAEPAPGQPGWVAETYRAGSNLFNGFSGSVHIKINTYDAAGFWSQEAPAARAETLLHELGHAFNDLRGAGHFALPNTVETKTNPYPFDNLVKSKCF